MREAAHTNHLERKRCWVVPLVCLFMVGGAGCDEGTSPCSDPTPDCDACPDASCAIDGDVAQDADQDEQEDTGTDATPDADADVDADEADDSDVSDGGFEDSDVVVECDEDSDCDDGDGCTWNRCEEGVCRFGVPEGAVLRLGSTGTDWAELELDLEGPGVTTVGIRCESTQNEGELFAHGFDDGNMAPFILEENGSVLHEADADNPAGFGARLCDDWATITAGPFDLTLDPTERVALRFALNGDDLGDDEFLDAVYSPNWGTTYYTLAIVGDETVVGWQRYQIILPPAAQVSDGVYIRFRRHGGSDSSCGDVDDIELVELAPSLESEQRLWADFQTQLLEPFVGVVDQPDDLQIINYESSYRVSLTDRNGAFIWAPVETLGIPSTDQLQISWMWRDSHRVMGWNNYGLAEYSVDAGVSWLPLAAIGMNQPVTPSTRFGVVLGGRAYNLEELRIRFRAPETTTNLWDVGTLIDDVEVSAEQLDLVDTFSDFSDDGDGTYGTMLTSSALGERTIRCQWSCGSHLFESNTTSLSL